MVTQREKVIQSARLNNLLSLCDAVKTVKYDNEQSVRDFYFYCLHQRNNGCYYALDKFKEWFPKQFSYMQAILNKRTLIRRDIEIMKALDIGKVVFGALTFNDNELVDNEANMRKKAQRHLDKFLSIYELVEEYGEEKGRYHIHFLGVMRRDKTYIDFHNQWSSYSYIEGLRSVKKASKYLCDYVVKQVPRIRRTKLFCKVIEKYKLYQRVIEEDRTEAAFMMLDILKLCDYTEEELPF